MKRFSVHVSRSIEYRAKLGADLLCQLPNAQMTFRTYAMDTMGYAETGHVEVAMVPTIRTGGAVQLSFLGTEQC
jgi:hypothetical protein